MGLFYATYKETQYALTLFFHIVETNLDQQVVATFLIEEETKENIIVALAIIKEWNLDSELLYAMVGCNTEEINALKTLYPGKY